MHAHAPGIRDSDHLSFFAGTPTLFLRTIGQAQINVAACRSQMALGSKCSCLPVAWQLGALVEVAFDPDAPESTTTTTATTRATTATLNHGFESERDTRQCAS